MLLKTSDYLRVLDLRPEYGQCDTNNPTHLRALARVVYQRLGQIELLPGAGNVPLLNRHMLRIGLRFKGLAKNRRLTVDEFNVQMAELYNWATSPAGAFGNKYVCQILLED